MTYLDFIVMITLFLLRPVTCIYRSKHRGVQIAPTPTRYNPNPPIITAPNPPSLPLYTYSPSRKKPTTRPSRSPTARPSSKPTARSTPNPTGRLRLNPTARPSAKPTVTPSSRPSSKPVAKPTLRPSARPSMKPIKYPSVKPTTSPVARPSISPSAKPTVTPSSRPSSKPVAKPTLRPSARPSMKPIKYPSVKPTTSPVARPSISPSAKPTVTPSSRPSSKPVAKPTLRPSARPSMKPIKYPSVKPTTSPVARPSIYPGAKPTVTPTSRPSSKPVAKPTLRPSARPSMKPIKYPSVKPTTSPVARPSISPSAKPTVTPTSRPSSKPVAKPTLRPSARPSMKPIKYSSVKPTTSPVARPSISPSAKPTVTPTSRPSSKPVAKPTLRPSVHSSSDPTIRKSSIPSATSTSFSSKPVLPTVCSVGTVGDFGNVSNSNQASNVDFNYQMIVNTTILNSTGYDIPTIVHQVEIAVTNLILNDLFSVLCSSVNSTMVGDGRYRRTTQRFLASNDQIIGITARPDDVISFNQCAAVNAPIPTDATCYLVFSRLTVYTSDPSSTSSITEVIIRLVSEAMNSRQLDETNAAIVRLVYYSDVDKDILETPSIIINTNAAKKQLPIILGVILGAAALIIVLFVAAINRRKKESDDEFHLRDGSISSFDDSHLIDFVDSSGRISSSNLSSPVEDDPDPFFDAEEDSPHSDLIVSDIDIRHSYFDHVDEYQTGQCLTSMDSHVVETASEDHVHRSEYIQDVGSQLPIILPIPSGSALVSFLGESSYDASATSPSSENSCRVMDNTMLCSICNKSMEGMPRKYCACGKANCELSAHKICVLEKYPGPSVSHPGTPPTMLPVILCRYKPKT